MAVPAQVQARADKADELLKQAQASTEKPAGEAPAGSTGDRDTGKPAPAAETVDSLKALLAETQQKLATLQGKYTNEIQALKDDVNLLNNLKNQVRTQGGQLQDLTGKLNEANRLNGDLQKQLSERPAAPAAADDGKGSLSNLSAEDLEYLRGEGFDDKAIGIIMKAAAGKGTAKSTQVDEVAEIKKELEAEKAKTFWKELSDKVPDWEPINGSDPFNDWLDLTLPYSNETRRGRLQTAQRDADYSTVIQIFTDFKSANPSWNKQPEHRIDPNKQIEPANSVVNQRDPAGKETPAGKLYTRQEVREFYANLSKAAAKNEITDEMKKTDADIIMANKEGRIQG